MPVQRDLLVGLGLAALEPGLAQRAARAARGCGPTSARSVVCCAQRRLGDVGRQDVLPDRVADRAVEERDAGAARPWARAAASTSSSSGVSTLRVQRAATPASEVNWSMSSTPETTRSWLPPRQIAARSRTSARHSLGLAAVADDVAEAPELVDALVARVLEHRLQRLQVAVDVRYDRDAQELPATRRRGRRRRRTPAAA